jgi:hypothetical protein
MATDRLRVLTRTLDGYSRALRLEGADADRYSRIVGPRLKNEVGAAARAAFGSDLKPWTGKGAKAGFGYDVEPASNGVRIVFKLRPAGVWAFGESGAGPHLIGGGRNYRRGTRPARGKTKGATVRYVKAAGYGHPVLAPVLHPGTKGRGAIRYAFKRVRQEQRDAVKAGLSAVLEGVRSGR